ncbi:MAG: hypothetical protein KKC68_06155 [Candidatus Thermoplasmatota archaeon]|nr:hypothetical protein [Candidatus Thermoplasmatota archaeon]MBU1941340.1 hypothetical protein [Candidatus Thermoplasmatota archaeon]
MSKNKDMIIILLIVCIGMFIPFLGSIILVFGFHIGNILTTFGWFLILFGLELGVVYLYFSISNWYATKKYQQLKPK